MSDANEHLMSGGVRSATLKNVGDWVEGFIYQLPEFRQRRDIKTRLPVTYEDGNPAMEIRAVLMTELHDDDNDDGLRAIYIPLYSAIHAAVREAVRAADAAGLEIGGKLRVKHSGVGPPKQAGFNGPKLYEAQYRAPEAAPVPVPVEPDDDIPF